MQRSSFPKMNMKLRNTLTKLKETSTETPIMFNADMVIGMLMLLNILKQNENDCYMKINRIGKDDYITISTKGEIQLNRYVNRVSQGIEKCGKRQKMLVVPLIIMDYKHNSSHANMLIFNQKRNEIERFEPHGISTVSNFANSRAIDKSVKELVKQVNENLKSKFKFVNSYQFCPYIPGFQEIESQAMNKTLFNHIGNVVLRNTGYCLMWSLFYANLRIKFPSITSHKIIKTTLEVVGNYPQALKNFIRGQNIFLLKQIQELDKNSKAIPISFEEFTRLSRKKTTTKKENNLINIYASHVSNVIIKEYRKLSS